MTNEEKTLLLKELLARLPYGVKVFDDLKRKYKLDIGNAYLIDMFYGNGDFVVPPITPYLRPLFSMTEKEKDELRGLLYFGYPSDDYDRYGHRGIEIAMVKYDDWKSFELDFEDFTELQDWLYAHHFDFRNLIEKGLALIAPEGMYSIK